MMEYKGSPHNTPQKTGKIALLQLVRKRLRFFASPIEEYYEPNGLTLTHTVRARCAASLNRSIEFYPQKQTLQK